MIRLDENFVIGAFNLGIRMKSVLLNSDFVAPVHILGEVAAKICAECKMVVSGRNSVIFYCFSVSLIMKHS